VVPPTESPTGYQKSSGLDIQYKRTSGAGLKGENKKTVGVLRINMRKRETKLSENFASGYNTPPFQQIKD
jgi:hypothetical protein